MENLLIQDIRFIAISIFFGAIVVFFICWILDKSKLSDWFKASEGITPSFITVPAFLFGLAISTLASGVWEIHASANASLVNESSSVGVLMRTSSKLSPEDRKRLVLAINNYVNEIIDSEWPAMESNDYKNRDAALSKLEALSAAANEIGMKENSKESIDGRLNSAIDSLFHERLQRLSYAFDRPNFARWPSIFVLSFLLLFTVGLLQLRSPRAMRISLTMGALCIGSSLIFLFLNISPYRGLNAVKPNMLKNSLEMYSAPNPK